MPLDENGKIDLGLELDEEGKPIGGVPIGPNGELGAILKGPNGEILGVVPVGKDGKPLSVIPLTEQG